MPNLRVYGNLTPEAAQRNSSNGIAQVVLAMHQYLPRFGYKMVNSPDEARLHVNHAGGGDRHSDIAICHGLYPTAYKELNLSGVHHEMNQRVIKDAVGAEAVICPSQWVADILRRDLHIEPHVINWGVHLEQWPQQENNKGYVLWNKNRKEGVCSPEPMHRLAALAPNVPFVTTFGRATGNVNVIGVQPFELMQNYIRESAFYLATTKETGDIGSREALACGIPVLGFKHGAITDFVRHGVNGFLAEVDDYEGLKKGLDWCLRNRDALSENALRMSRHYGWRDAIHAMSKVFDSVVEKRYTMDVSIIIPCYNYADFIGDAIRSVFAQETTKRVELIVVDDGSTDNSYEVIQSVLQDFARHDIKSVLIQQANAGVGHARNTGIKRAKGKYIACLDADDMMGPRFIQTCAKALDESLPLGIAYTKLEIMSHGVSHWPSDFDMNAMLKGHNQVPSLCMFRKEAWHRAGGYRQAYHTAEDARLWLDIVELGYDAKMVTTEALYKYRNHPNSATRKNGRYQMRREPNWRGGKGYLQTGELPAGLQGAVKNYDSPLVSFIIPVGSGHEQYVKDAIDSVKSQTITDWECIVINDTGVSISVPPFVRLITTSGGKGAAYCRNKGLDIAQGRFITFLDADDIIYPDFIKRTYDKYLLSGYYVYIDYDVRFEGKIETRKSLNFTPDLITRKAMFHPITALVPREDIMGLEARFDEKMRTWEDCDFYFQLITGGLCGERLAESLMLYRLDSGTLREKGAVHSNTLIDYMAAKWSDYITGEEDIVCSCNKPKKQVALNGANSAEIMLNAEASKGRFPTSGSVGITGMATKTYYGQRSHGDRFVMLSDDIAAWPEVFQMVAQVDIQAPQTQIPEDLVQV